MHSVGLEPTTLGSEVNCNRHQIKDLSVVIAEKYGIELATVWQHQFACLYVGRWAAQTPPERDAGRAVLHLQVQATVRPVFGDC